MQVTIRVTSGLIRQHPALSDIYSRVYTLLQATINMLRIAEPFIAWGYPNLKSVKQLVYKRGYGKIDNRRIPITNNEMIEKKLSEYSLVERGFVCVFLF